MSVVVQLELGHTAIERDRPTKLGHTHDWKVFVRGPNDCAIENFIDKVVFHLPDSFPKSKRVKKKPPFQVSESGNAGFTMPIDVYFRTKEEPKKMSFNYDLYLRVGEKVSNIRLEKLTFQNPVEEFRKKLLLGGGIECKHAEPRDKKRPQKQTIQSNQLEGPQKGSPGCELDAPAPGTPGPCEPTTGPGEPIPGPMAGPMGPSLKNGYGKGPNSYKAAGNYSAPQGDAHRKRAAGSGYHPYRR